MQVPLHTPIYPPFNDPRAVLARPKRMGGEYSDQQIKRQRLNTPLPVSHLSNTALTMPAQQYFAADPNQQIAQFQGFLFNPTIHGPFQAIQWQFLPTPAVLQETEVEILPALSNNFIQELKNSLNGAVSVENLCTDPNQEIAKLGKFLFEESSSSALAQDEFPATPAVLQEMQIATVHTPVINGPISSSVILASQDRIPHFSVLENGREVPHEIALPFNEHDAQSSSLLDTTSLQNGLRSRSELVKKSKSQKYRDHIKEIRDPIVKKYLNNKTQGEKFLEDVPENLSGLQKYLKDSIAKDRNNSEERIRKTVLFYLYRFSPENKERKKEEFIGYFNKNCGIYIDIMEKYLNGIESQLKLQSSDEDKSKKKDVKNNEKYYKNHKNRIDEIKNSVMNKIKKNELKKEEFSGYISKLQELLNNGGKKVIRKKIEIILPFYIFHYKNEDKSMSYFISDIIKNCPSISRKSIRRYVGISE